MRPVDSGGRLTFLTLLNRTSDQIAMPGITGPAAGQCTPALRSVTPDRAKVPDGGDLAEVQTLKQQRRAFFFSRPLFRRAPAFSARVARPRAFCEVSLDFPGRFWIPSCCSARPTVSADDPLIFLDWNRLQETSSRPSLLVLGYSVWLPRHFEFIRRSTSDAPSFRSLFLSNSAMFSLFGISSRLTPVI